MNQTIKILFNDEITHKQAENFMDIISILLDVIDLTAVIFLEEVDIYTDTSADIELIEGDSDCGLQRIDAPGDKNWKIPVYDPQVGGIYGQDT